MAVTVLLGLMCKKQNGDEERLWICIQRVPAYLDKPAALFIPTIYCHASLPSIAYSLRLQVLERSP